MAGELRYLHVPDVQVVPDVGRHDVPQPLQVLLPAEVFQRPVAPRHVLLNSVKIQTETLQQLLRAKYLLERRENTNMNGARWRREREVYRGVNSPF